MTWADLVVRGTVILAVAFAGAYAARRASAAVRHFVWTLAFVAVLLLPAVREMGPKFALPFPASTPVVRAVPAALPVTAPGGVAKLAAPAPVRPASSRSQYLAALYLAGLLLVLGRFTMGAMRMGRMVRGASPAHHAVAAAEQVRTALGIGRAVRVLESPDAAVPMTWGIRRPVVLLPRAAREWPEDRLHAVLMHEMVHVARFDLLAQMVAQAACCLYWFHPLMWAAARQLRRERERACDDAVLDRGLAAPEYAGHLMELARVLVEGQASLADAPAMAEAGDLEERVRALLDRSRNRAPLSRRAVAAVSVLACALVLPVASVTSHAQAARGALAGIVQDISKARVPGCSVTVKNLDGSNQERTTVNAAGEYTFPAIPPGRYVVEVRARGFAITSVQAVVQSGAAARADVTLEVGKISESVTVTRSRPSGSPAAQPAAIPAGAPQRIRVGGNVQAAKLVRQPRPDYPDELARLGISGTVMLRAVISITGEPMNVEVTNTTVDPRLAASAVAAVRQWRYEPTLLNGQPVEVVTTIDVTFALEQ
jgi:TonB family protein